MRTTRRHADDRRHPRPHRRTRRRASGGARADRARGRGIGALLFKTLGVGDDSSSTWTQPWPSTTRSVTGGSSCGRWSRAPSRERAQRPDRRDVLRFVQRGDRCTSARCSRKAKRSFPRGHWARGRRPPGTFTGGVNDGGTSQDRMQAKHDASYVADNGDRLERRTRAARWPSSLASTSRERHIGAAARPRSRGIAARRRHVHGRRCDRQPGLLRLARSYTWVLLGAAVVFVVMERALITGTSRWRTWRSTAARGTGCSTSPRCGARSKAHPAVGAHPPGYLAAIVVKFRNRIDDPLFGWALLTMFAVCGFFFLVLRAGEPLPALRPERLTTTAPARTRCCRTTS